VSRRDWTRAALVAALYAVVTWAIAPWAFGILQFRASELLKPLALRGRKYIAGLTAGLFLANLASPQIGVWELLLMPLACYLGGELAYRLRAMPWLAVTVYAAWVGVSVGAMLHWVVGLPWLVSAASVFAAELPLMLVGVKVTDYLLRSTQAGGIDLAA